jgi:branched-chain amino acid aminotransferase
MEIIDIIEVKRTNQSRLNEVDMNDLQFGKYVSDHMFISAYNDGEWQKPAIVPFQNLSLSPTTLALHYGQSIFEGMKAFRMHDGHINIFRIEKHFERLTKSLQRMCMPEIPHDLFVNALQQLITVDKDWVPTTEGSSLYIRPFVFASEARFGVKVSDEYLFIIFTGPVRSAFQRPINVKVERKYIRAAKGGTGYAKCAGNYGGAFFPTQLAKEEGFDQIIWTDASHHEYIEESGFMNLMFVINGKLMTPPLSDSILDGITRDSLLNIARGYGFPVEERPISLIEIIEAFKDGSMEEAFGVGTAAVVAPIASINIDGIAYSLPEYINDTIHSQLKDELEAMRSGLKEDVYNWNNIID